MFNISNTFQLKDDTFEVRLHGLARTKVEELAESEMKYRSIQDKDHVLIMSVFSKGVESEIILDEKDIVQTIDSTIEELITLEMYEHCEVLKNIKETYKKYCDNDN